jgi:hypothetical protein
MLSLTRRFAVPTRLLVPVLAMILGLAAPPAAGQTSIEVAPRIGANIATVASDTASNVSRKTSLMGGVAVRIGLPGPLSLQPELLVSPKGAEVSAPQGGDVRFSATYVELPVTVRADLPTIRGAVTPFVQGGGFAAVKIFEQQSVGGFSGQLPLDFDQSFYRRFDGGLTAGIGAAVDRLAVTARYSYGLATVVKDDIGPTFEENPNQRPPADGTSDVWSISVSFGF